MEVSLQVAKAPKEGETVKEEDVLMTCAFTMVFSTCIFLLWAYSDGCMQRYLWTQKPRSPSQ
jgi:hypothetical protein